MSGSWYCPQCGRHNIVATECWQCSTPRPGISAVAYRTPACGKHLSRNDEHECPWCKLDEYEHLVRLEQQLEASLEFMNDGVRVDFVNLRKFLEVSREALLVMQQIEEALRHGFSVEPGSFLHDEVTRLCSGSPKR